jgi:hypothetical protein
MEYISPLLQGRPGGGRGAGKMYRHGKKGYTGNNYFHGFSRTRQIWIKQA